MNWLPSKKNAYALGVASHAALDVTEVYYRKCIRYMVYGNILKNNTYPLSVSSERIFQALAIVDYARKVGARYIAHGSTGAGNDPGALRPHFSDTGSRDGDYHPDPRPQTIARRGDRLSEEKCGVQRDWTRMAYSINKGLWGTSVGGKKRH